MANWGSKLSRRYTLRIIGAGGVSAGLLPIVGCGGEDSGGGGGGDEPEDATGCNAPIDEQSQQMRRTLQYVDESQVEGRECSNCAQYVADQYGDCGGCNVMSGPVQPGGHCLSWAAVAEAPAGGGDEAPAEDEPPAEEAPAADEGETTEG